MDPELKSRYFNDASSLTAYVNDEDNEVDTIVAITFDFSSGKYVLFYTEAA